MKKLVMFALVATIGFSAFANAGEKAKVGDAEKGKALSASCAACHGADGNSTTPGTAKNKDILAEGESIYRGGISDAGVAACSACHGPTGAGVPSAKFPKVSGQHAKYATLQLQAFKSGERNNDTGKMMRNMVKRMTDAQMEAVSE